MPPTAGAFALTLSVLLSAACASSMTQTRRDRGTITIGVTTSGTAAASLTFRLTVEPAGIVERIKADAGVFTKRDLPLGTHVVRLLDVPAHCRIDGGAERTITMSQQRRSVVLRFDVHCAAESSRS